MRTEWQRDRMTDRQANIWISRAPFGAKKWTRALKDLTFGEAYKENKQWARALKELTSGVGRDISSAHKFFYLSLLRLERDTSNALMELTLGEAYKVNEQGPLRSSPWEKSTKNINKISRFSTLSLLNVGRDISRALKELTLGEAYKNF